MNNNKEGILFTTAASGTERDLAQDDNSMFGKILFLSLDSEKKIIFSKGHRNPQGIYLSEKNVISVEHGPKGGDEVNLLFKGKNYGWPLTSLGSNYDLTEISKSTFFNEIETEVPADLAIFPPPPGLISTLWISIPTGISDNGKQFPTFISESPPFEILSPIFIPCGAK